MICTWTVREVLDDVSEVLLGPRIFEYADDDAVIWRIPTTAATRIEGPISRRYSVNEGCLSRLLISNGIVLVVQPSGHCDKKNYAARWFVFECFNRMNQPYPKFVGQTYRHEEEFG